MRILLQRVQQAFVVVESREIARIQRGYLCLVGIGHGDEASIFDVCIQKILHMRLFSDEDGKMNHSLVEKKGEVLLVSQFTLYGEVKKGNRPSYGGAASMGKAADLYERFVKRFRTVYPSTKSGLFGADMKVHLINDGPVTIWMERHASLM